jgi:suppressor for copper-sensitivity B
MTARVKRGSVMVGKAIRKCPAKCVGALILILCTLPQQAWWTILKRMRFLFLALLAFVSTAAVAQTPAVPSQPGITAALVAPYTTVGTDIKVPLLLQINLPKGWHTYWRSPGVAGLPPRLTFNTQQNVREVNIEWPAPTRFEDNGLQTFGYKDRAVLPMYATLVDASKPIILKGTLDIIMCDEICIPASAPIEINLPAGVATRSGYYGSWQAALATLPTVPEKVALRTLERAGDKIVAVVDHPKNLAFTDMVVETPDSLILLPALVETVDGGSKFTAGFDVPEESVRVPQGQVLTLTLLGERPVVFANAVGYNSADPRPMPQTLADWQTETYPGEKGRPPAPTMAEVAADHGLPANLALIILFALLGGLILNLMPCVLPVLSLKLLSVISHAGESRAHIRAGFLATTAGILVSFWVLAGAMIALKSAGMAVGWGIQFQQPAFLAVMMVIVLTFAANMFGLFEFRAPRFIQAMAGGPNTNSNVLTEFFTGIFATLLATPCTAPFVGTAVGFALGAGAYEIIAVFTAMGIGLALPYLLVAVVPTIAQKLPRPGAWMVKVRYAMGIALLATAVWLGWVVVAQIAPTAAPTAAEQQQEGALPWQPFAPESIPTLVAQGKIVFVDITADWCLTCHANKRLVINRDPVNTTLRADTIHLMRGDWTNPDATIQQYLADHMRFGIPFNIVYGPHAPQGILLPELLSSNAVLDAIEKAGLR